MPGTFLNISCYTTSFNPHKNLQAIHSYWTHLQIRKISPKCGLSCMRWPQRAFPKHCPHHRHIMILTFTIKSQRILTASPKLLVLSSNFGFHKTTNVTGTLPKQLEFTINTYAEKNKPAESSLFSNSHASFSLYLLTDMAAWSLLLVWEGSQTGNQIKKENVFQ